MADPPPGSKRVCSFVFSGNAFTVSHTHRPMRPEAAAATRTETLALRLA